MAQRMLTKSNVLSVLFSLAFGFPTAAALIAADDFDYDNSSVIEGLNGGSGWAGPWTGKGFITPGSLALSKFPPKGHKATTVGEGSRCAFRTLASAGHEALTEDGKYGKDNTTIWISFLINAPVGTTKPGYGGISLLEGLRERLFIGDTGASNVWAIERQGQLQRFTSRNADSNTCFVVCRIKFLPGPERLDLWIDPPLNIAQPSEAQAAASADAADDFRFDRIRFCSAPLTMNCDALRIGTTYRDVVPSSRWMSDRFSTWLPWIAAVVLFLLLICTLVLLAIVASGRRPRDSRLGVGP